jgi:hypothetical protein
MGLDGREAYGELQSDFRVRVASVDEIEDDSLRGRQGLLARDDSW